MSSTYRNYVLTVSGSSTFALSASVNSDPFPLHRVDVFSVQLTAITSSATNAVTGTIQLQASNDDGYNPGTGLRNITGVSNWTNVASASVTLSNTDGPYMIAVDKPGFAWGRIAFNRTGGGANSTGSYRVFAQGRS